jgi:hypothetical protein
MTSIRFRGNSLSDNKRNQAISQTQFYEYKNKWVLLQCWLHCLSEKGELPKLNSNDEIFISEDFNPPVGLVKRYRKRFNKKEKSFREKWIKDGFFQIPEIKEKLKSDGELRETIFNNHYKSESTPGNKICTAKELGIKDLNHYDNKISWVLADSLFWVKSYFEFCDDGTFKLVKKLEKKFPIVKGIGEKAILKAGK